MGGGPATVLYKGSRFSVEAAASLRELDRLTPTIPVVITQGGWNAGAVSASATSHDCDAVDISVRSLSTEQVATIVTTLRMLGWAAWLRTVAQGFTPHIHAIPVGWGYVSGSAWLTGSAAFQAAEYLAGRNGLAGRGRDDGPRDYVGQTWPRYFATHQEDDMPTLDEVRAVIRAELAPVRADVADVRADAARTIAAVNDTRALALVKAEGDPAVWLTDGLTAVHVPDTTTLQDLATLAAEGRLSISLEGGYGVEEVAGVPVRTVRPSTLAALGAVTAEEL